MFMAKARAQYHYNAGSKILFQIGFEKWSANLAKNPWNAPQHIDVMTKLLHGNIKKLETGTKHFIKAVKLDPNFAFAFHNLAHTYYNMAEYVVNAAHVDGRQLQVCILAPGMWYLDNQTDSFPKRISDIERDEEFIKNLLESALQSVDRALTIRYDFPQAHNTRAMVLARLGRIDEAIQSTEIALLQEPNYKNAYDNQKKMRLMRSQL